MVLLVLLLTLLLLFLLLLLLLLLLLTTTRPSGAHDLECFEIEGGGLLMAVVNARDDNTQAVPTLVCIVGR